MRFDLSDAARAALRMQKRLEYRATTLKRRLACAGRAAARRTLAGPVRIEWFSKGVTTRYRKLCTGAAAQVH
ncbi:hypothetical protein [Caballeronia glathei]|jgi:hypothetical protein|uniref:hypothetical protein n=1 Tax=Caballeronia glathei TaxID=60547 RepID=UPI00101A6F0F|nr:MULTISPECIES: hypothetical protein [Burkholderiaceae]